MPFTTFPIPLLFVKFAVYSVTKTRTSGGFNEVVPRFKSGAQINIV